MLLSATLWIIDIWNASKNVIAICQIHRPISMMTSLYGNFFSALLAICEGNSPVTGAFPSGQWCGALMFSLTCTWTNSWAKIERLVIWDAIALIIALLWCQYSLNMLSSENLSVLLYQCQISERLGQWQVKISRFKYFASAWYEMSSRISKRHHIKIW